MPDSRPLPDDEIDLFELFETLWKGKWLIVACIAVASLGGFAFTKTAQPNTMFPFHIHLMYTSRCTADVATP